MSRRIASAVLIVAGVAFLAPALPAAEEAAPAVFVAPEEGGLPASAAVPLSAPEEQKAAAPVAEKSVEPSGVKAEAPVEGKAVTKTEKKSEEAAPAADQKPGATPEEATPVAAEKAAPDASSGAKTPAKETAAAGEKEAPPPLPEAEQKLHEMIKKAFGPAGRALVKDRMPREIFASQAVLRGIEKNLSIQRTAVGEENSRAAIQEAKAVFDPVITVSFNHTAHTQYSRYAKVQTFQQGSMKSGGADVLDEAGKAIPKFPMKLIAFDEPRIQGYPVKHDVASVKNPNGPVVAERPSFRFDQQLPWGPSVYFLLASQRQETYFDDGPDSRLDAMRNQLIAQETALRQEMATAVADQQAQLQAQLNDVLAEEDKVTKAFKKSVLHFAGTNRPWSSSMTVGAFIPIPETKDWGQYSWFDANRKIVDLNNDRAFWDTKTVVNFTLRDVDWAYWDVVNAVENLRAVTENRGLLERVQGNVQERLDKKLVTEYSKLQIDTQLASVKEQEEQAWSFYVQTSNALANLLDIRDNVVLLPAGYTKNLAEQVPLNVDAAYAVAAENRPDLKAQKISGQVSEVLLRYRQNQVRPDLKLSSNIRFSQNPQPFGYETWTDSVGGLFGSGSHDTKHEINVLPPGQKAQIQNLKKVSKAEDTAGPDNRVHSHTLSYNWPVGNRGVKADLRVAEADRDMQDIQIQRAENSVEEDVGDAVVGLLSAKAQYEIGKQNYDLALAQYKMANDLLTAGRITDFEIITRTADVLTADLNKIAAGIAYKKAETQLLQAQGILPNTYATLRAENDLDKYRMEALAAVNALQFFKPVAEHAAAAGASKTNAGDAGGK